MSNQARITSIEALELFRAHLIEFLGRARVALDDATGEIRRTREWLEHDCPRHWLGQIKLAEKHLAQAEQELFSVNLTAPGAHHAARKMAVMKARRRLAGAREKLHVAKEWKHRFGPRVESLVNQLNPLEEQIGHNLPKGVHMLTECIKALQDYAGTNHSTPPSA
jgi:hypothetical protein